MDTLRATVQAKGKENSMWGSLGPSLGPCGDGFSEKNARRGPPESTRHPGVTRKIPYPPTKTDPPRGYDRGFMLQGRKGDGGWHDETPGVLQRGLRLYARSLESLSGRTTAREEVAKDQYPLHLQLRVERIVVREDSIKNLCRQRRQLISSEV